ncbi:hypothetical protein Tco_0476403 [Tanacetum coccineum]
MMLPNALFDAADLFVAAINGVWRWWSVGDVGDLTWVKLRCTILRYLGVLKLESEGDHVHLAIGKFPGLKNVTALRLSPFSYLQMRLLKSLIVTGMQAGHRQMMQHNGLCLHWRHVMDMAEKEALQGHCPAFHHWKTCYSGIDFKCGDWKMGKLGMRSGMAGIRIRDNLGAGEWKWKEYSGSCDVEGGLDDSWRLSVLKL